MHARWTAVLGYWGVPTSTVDWCEANYQVTPWVAEFWNTLSSLAMVSAGILGLWVYRHRAPRRFLFAFGLLILVGLGSIAFHATLRREMQMMDELPMLYLVTWMVYLLVEEGPAPRFGRWFPAALVGYAIAATLVSSLNLAGLQFALFHISFGSLELWCLWRVSRLLRRDTPRAERRRFGLGMAAYVLGIAVWSVDLRFCVSLVGWLSARGLPNPQLHAWWHLFVSIGFFLLLSFVAQNQRGALRLGAPRRV